MFKRFSSKSGKTTSFAAFIQNAKAKEKKKVYARVLNKATEHQQAVVDAARA